MRLQEHVQFKKRAWGALTGRWVPPDTRDEVVDFVNYWDGWAELAVKLLILWLGLSLSKFYAWRTRYRKVNEHNGQVPRDAWLLDEEKQAILDYKRNHPPDGSIDQSEFDAVLLN